MITSHIAQLIPYSSLSLQLPQFSMSIAPKAEQDRNQEATVYLVSCSDPDVGGRKS